MKFLLLLALTFTWVTPLSAASITKALEFKRGEIREVDVTGFVGNYSDLYVVTVISEDGNLIIFVFSGEDTSPRSRLELGRASSVSVVSISQNIFTTAMRNSNGKLQLTTWQVSPDGRNLARLGNEYGPAINKVEVSNAGTGRVRLAAQLSSGNLFVTTATLEDNGTLELNDGETYGQVKSFALARGVLGGLAMKTKYDEFKITAFFSGGASGVIRGQSNDGGSISELSLVGLDDFVQENRWISLTSSDYIDTGGSSLTPPHCIGAAIVVPYSPIGRGKMIAWKHKGSLQQSPIERIGEYEFSGIEGLAHKVGILNFSNGGGDWFFTAHQGYDKPCSLKPRIEIHLWKFDDGFQKLATKELGGDYDDFAMARTKPQGNNTTSRFVIAARGRVNNKLKITIWDAER